MSASQPSQNQACIHLRVYVAGSAPNSVIALARLRALLACYPSVASEVEVVDVLEQPEIGLRDRILVTPTTVKLEPLPECRIIGSLSDIEGVASLLGLASLAARQD